MDILAGHDVNFGSGQFFLDVPTKISRDFVRVGTANNMVLAYGLIVALKESLGGISPDKHSRMELFAPNLAAGGKEVGKVVVHWSDPRTA